jgi:hypothetical protein
MVRSTMGIRLARLSHQTLWSVFLRRKVRSTLPADAWAALALPWPSASCLDPALCPLSAVLPREPKQPEAVRAITVEAPGVQKIYLGVTLDELWAEREQQRTISSSFAKAVARRRCGPRFPSINNGRAASAGGSFVPTLMDL